LGPEVDYFTEARGRNVLEDLRSEKGLGFG